MPKHPRIALRLIAFAFSAASGLSGARAQTGPAAPAGSPPLEHLLVTASRTPIETQRVGSSVTVVTRGDLEQGRYRFVADALRETAGIAVSRGGGLGGVTQLRMRGAEGNHTLVLIDGTEANNPVSNSEFDFAHLAVADIERIEILRGPQSALYGSDAIGGVINIITRRPPEGMRSALELEAGERGTQALNASLSQAVDTASWGLALSSLGTDGENFSRFGNERDGFRNRSLSVQGNLRLSEQLRWENNLRMLESAQDFDAQDFSFPPTATEGMLVDQPLESEARQWFLRSQATLDRERWTHRFGLSLTDTDNRFFDASLPTGGNSARKTKFDLQSSRQLPALGLLTLAAEHESVDYRNAGADPLAPENQSRHDTQSSVVVELQTRWRAVDLSASGRYDANRLFDDATAYRLTASRPLNERLRLRGSLGTGVANPGFFELFGFFPDSFVGNPALAPETSTSLDLGVDSSLAEGRVQVDATLFFADLTNEIETVFDSETFLATVVNLPGESRRRGIELGASALLTRAWDLTVRYTYTDAEQPDGQTELRRPAQIASLGSSFRFAGERGLLRVSMVYTGAQQDADFRSATPPRVTLPSFTVMRLATEFRLSERWRIFGRIENLLDERYEEWFSYRSPSRLAALGLAYDAAR